MNTILYTGLSIIFIGFLFLWKIRKKKKTMASKIIKIKVSNASNLQIQTLLLEIGLIIKQWFRKVKVKIEVIK